MKYNEDFEIVECRIDWDDAKQKKIVAFADGHGAKMYGSNASAVQMGKHGVGIDVDTKNLAEIDERIASILMMYSYTTETARGKHWVFWVDDNSEFTQQTNIVPRVDIRGGGKKSVLFSEYRGTNPNIKYKINSNDIEKMPDELVKVLRELYREKSAPYTKQPLIKHNEREHSEKASFDDVRDALSFVPASSVDYEEWIKIGMALKSWDVSDGAYLFDEWSSQDAIRYNPREMERKINSFKGSGITIATLFKLAMNNGYTKQNVTKYDVMPFDAVEPLKPKEEGGKIISVLEQLQLKATTRKQLKERGSSKMIVDNLIAEKHHTYIFGASGSMKSSIVASMMLKIATEGYTVHYWGLDTNVSFNDAVLRIAEERNISDKFLLFEDVTIADFKEAYKGIAAQKNSMSKIIVVMDTYKFLAGDVNNKKNNQDAMHFIKEMIKSGATVVSIGHTNKDGDKQSGTGEIEQDSDAIFKVSTCEKDKERYSIIEKAGRVRFRYDNPVTFASNIDHAAIEFASDEEHEGERWYQLINSLDHQDVDFDIAAEAERQLDYKADKYNINIVRGILQSKGTMRITELTSLSASDDMALIGQHKFKALILKYQNKEWILDRRKNEKNAMYVKIIDYVGETIQNLKNDIDL